MPFEEQLIQLPRIAIVHRGHKFEHALNLGEILNLGAITAAISQACVVLFFLHLVAESELVERDAEVGGQIKQEEAEKAAQTEWDVGDRHCVNAISESGVDAEAAMSAVWDEAHEDVVALYADAADELLFIVVVSGLGDLKAHVVRLTVDNSVDRVGYHLVGHQKSQINSRARR